MSVSYTHLVSKILICFIKFLSPYYFPEKQKVPEVTISVTSGTTDFCLPRYHPVYPCETHRSPLLGSDKPEAVITGPSVIPYSRFRRFFSLLHPPSKTGKTGKENIFQNPGRRRTLSTRFPECCSGARLAYPAYRLFSCRRLSVTPESIGQ